MYYFYFLVMTLSFIQHSRGRRGLSASVSKSQTVRVKVLKVLNIRHGEKNKYVRCEDTKEGITRASQGGMTEKNTESKYPYRSMVGNQVTDKRNNKR